MSGWDTPAGNDSWEETKADSGGFVADAGDFGASTNFNASADLGGESAPSGGGARGDGPCRNCGKEGHYVRECEEPKKLTGACFRCGQEGHNKADCTNEPVDRPFTGTCRVCSQEGHPASQCPEQTCRLCSKAGHRAIDCKEKRTVDFGETGEAKTAEAAWTEIKIADGEKDLDAFRKAFMTYAKAVIAEGGPFDLVELEKTFRDESMNAHLVAKKKDIPLDFTIVDFQGNADKTYVFGIQWAAKSRRKAFAEALAESTEENLARLADCGLVVDRGIPVCGNCQALGHTRKHCREESQTTKEVLTCANCGGEHRLRDCKEERVEKHGLSCRNCGEVGHKAVDCPTGEKRPPKACRNCGSEDHIAKDCTEPRNPATVKCRNCDEMGHFSKECPKPRDYSRVQCSQCQQFGHTSVRCKEPPAQGNDQANGNGGWGTGADNAESADVSGGWNDTTTGTAGDGW